MFGAYFGIACSFFINVKEATGNKKNTGGYFSNLVAFFGTVFLYMYWPSFNGGL